MLETITTNLAGGIVKNVTFNKRDYLVVPMVMITEGVHTGSNGPLYYPRNELGKLPVAWNMKPVVVYHPEMNGQGLSACDPDVAERQQVGMIMNTRWDTTGPVGKLRAEAWLEADRLTAVDKRVADAIEGSTLMEVSTGLFTDNQFDPGTWNGKEYELVARNYVPDHLAILPDKVGACSIADGAGLLQLNERATAAGIDVQRLVNVAIDDVRDRVDNVLSSGDTHEQLYKALKRRYGQGTYIADVFPKFVVFDTDDGSMKGLRKIGWAATNDAVQLSDEEPVPVLRVTAYRTEDGKVVTNATPTIPKEQVMKREQTVDKLIANKATPWQETDREVLLALNDEGLAAVEKTAAAATAAPPKDKEEEDGKTDKEKVQAAAENGASEVAAPPAPAANAQPAPQKITLDQLPPEMQAVYNHGLAALNADRQRYIAVITANEQNPYTPEQLATKPLDDLQALAKLAERPQPQQNQLPGLGGLHPASYAGQAVGNVAGAQTHNEEPLVPATMTFDEK